MSNKDLPIVRQANKIILGRQTVNIAAKRAIYFAAKGIKTSSKDPRKVVWGFEEFMNFIQVRKDTTWRGKKKIIDNIFDELNKNPVTIEEVRENGSIKYKRINWLQSLEYDSESDEICFFFADDITNYLIELKDEPYTKTIYQIGHFRSIFTARIKEILEAYRFRFEGGNMHYIDLPLEKLKWQLGVEKKYDRFSDFRRYVLTTAQKELKDTNSPVQFSYDTVNKRGKTVKRNIQAIRFYPIFKKVKTVQDAEKEVQKREENTPPNLLDTALTKSREEHAEIYIKLGAWHIKEEQIFSLLNEYGSERISEMYDYANAKATDNKAGFFVTGLLKGYTDPKAEERRLKEARRKRLEKLDRQKKQIEAQIEEVTREYNKKIDAISSVLVQDDDTLYNAVARAKESAGVGFGILARGETDPHKLYEKLSTRSIIQNELTKIFSQKFEPARQQYEPVIEGLERKKRLVMSGHTLEEIEAQSKG